MPSTARRSNSKQYLAKLKLNCTACTHRLLPRGWVDSGCGYAIFVLDSNTQVLKEHSSGKIHTTHGLVLGFGRCSQAAGIWIGMSTVLPSLRVGYFLLFFTSSFSVIVISLDSFFRISMRVERLSAVPV